MPPCIQHQRFGMLSRLPSLLELLQFPRIACKETDRSTSTLPLEMGQGRSAERRFFPPADQKKK